MYGKVPAILILSGVLQIFLAFISIPEVSDEGVVMLYIALVCGLILMAIGFAIRAIFERIDMQSSRNEARVRREKRREWQRNHS